MESNLIVLRSVFGKVNQTYFLTPSKSKKTGIYPDCVRIVDANGDMVLSETDKKEMSKGKVFIPSDSFIEVVDGMTFDLNNPMDKSKWEAIKDSPLIAQSRSAKDSAGNYIIDGSTGLKGKYGRAVLYVDIPGERTKAKVSRTKLVIEAQSYVIKDSDEGKKTKCKLLGRNMDSAYPTDIDDFLLDYAKRNPEKVIDVYTDSDVHVRMLFIDAVNKGIICQKNGVYMYGDHISMGVTDTAVIIYLKQPNNKKIRELIEAETYPEYFDESSAKKK